MSLQIVYGRSGSGKSSYLFNQIKQDLGQENKIYMITPEQFSFTAEKKLLEIAQSGAVLNAEVLTFQRMAYRVMQEVGGATKTNLEESGRSMLIYHILNEQKKNLKFLGKSEENIEVVLNSITEFKKHGIHVEQLVDAISHQENPYLSAKLEDMRLIYEEYEKQIQNQFIDENDILDILVENLEKTNQFTNAVIYIDEFAGFIKQEYQIIEKLLKVAKKVIVTITADSSLQQTQIEHDLFYSNKETAKRLMKLARENGIEIQKEVRLENGYRFKTRELAFLEQNLYQVPYHKYEKAVENISLFLAQNPYSEIEQVASQILSLVQKEGYRYQDISVITKNIDTYGSLAKVIFERYHIPVFIDEKRDLSQNILVKYLLSIMEVFAQNWSYESVISYIKNGFLEIPKQDLFYLENYCKKWDVKRNKW
ncbi:MAG: PD-(D/E)XK nuclease family protein, partial [Clostridia bacterium]